MPKVRGIAATAKLANYKLRQLSRGELWLEMPEEQGLDEWLKKGKSGLYLREGELHNGRTSGRIEVSNGKATITVTRDARTTDAAQIERILRAAHRVAKRAVMDAEDDEKFTVTFYNGSERNGKVARVVKVQGIRKLLALLRKHDCYGWPKNYFVGMSSGRSALSDGDEGDIRITKDSRTADGRFVEDAWSKEDQARLDRFNKIVAQMRSLAAQLRSAAGGDDYLRSKASRIIEAIKVASA